MNKKEITSGVVHKMPRDLQKNLTLFPRAKAEWEELTPLTRNEWICWIESAKKKETRNQKNNVPPHLKISRFEKS